MVKQETRKQQTEEHDETADQVGHASVAEDNTDEQADVSRSQIEEHKHQNEAEEFSPSRNQSGHRVHNDSHDDRRYQS